VLKVAQNSLFPQATLAVIRQLLALLPKPQDIVFVCALLLVGTSSLVGGASQANALAQMAVELAAVPLLCVSLYAIFIRGVPERTTFSLFLLVAIVAIPAIQLVPLPVAIWSEAPGRDIVLRALKLAHLDQRALPYSLTPESTWRGLLYLVPPSAMFLGTILLARPQRRTLAACWLGLAVFDVLLGSLQILGGPDSPLYFYSITNTGSFVGVFANRNHNAAYLLCMLPFAAMFVTRRRSSLLDVNGFGPILAALYFPIAIVGVAATHSRAGAVLLCIALLGSAGLALRPNVERHRWRPLEALGICSAVAIVAVLLFGLDPLLDRLDGTTQGDMRFQGLPVVLKAAKAYLPFGSGIGSFDPVYRTVEPLEQVSPVYFNHAHNDFLEAWLETGLAGAVLLMMFFVWLMARATALWKERAHAEPDLLPAACLLSVCILLAHSLVDYPLRTETLAVVFAFGCANCAVHGPKRAVRK
jgi:O-antigen ligase